MKIGKASKTLFRIVLEGTRKKLLSTPNLIILRNIQHWFKTLVSSTLSLGPFVTRGLRPLKKCTVSVSSFKQKFPE